MTIPGQVRGIHVRAALAQGRVVDVSLHSSRPLGVTRVLAGRPAGEALKLIPLLFPVCGRAQVIAGLRAVEAALDIEPDSVLEAARDLLVLAEQAGSLAWRIAIDWAPLAQRAPDARVVARVRESAQAVRFALFGDQPFDQLGPRTLQIDRARLGDAVGALQTGLLALFPEAMACDDLGDLEDALVHADSIPALLIRDARRSVPALFGQHRQDYFDEKSPDWFGARLGRDDGFSAMPTVDGRPAEVGPLAGLRHPLVVEALVMWGTGLSTRLLAASLDVITVPQRMADLTRRLVAGLPMDRQARLGVGIGSGLSETARGPLAHWVQLDGETVVDWRAVAPTEWNFHPKGPFACALSHGERLHDAERQIRVLAASFDPCVPLHVELREATA
jgi:Ni,Fe-hydrogenase I large subunit